MSAWHLGQAARALATGGIVAYPTEAVYGLGCDPLDPRAVLRLLALKRRDWRKGMILVAAEFSQVEDFLLPLTEKMRARVFATWPGPVTWLLPARPETPWWLRGASPSLAVRITSHPPTAALCRAWGGPLVSTSANLGGHPPARSAWRVRRDFGPALAYLLPGELGGRSRPSEIRDALGGEVVRAG